MADYPTEEIPFPLPPMLQTRLEQDCIQIVHHEKLLSLPVVPSIETILKDYWYHVIVTGNDEINMSLLMEVLDGIKIYFNFMLKDHLLYSEEKQQYDLIISPQSSNCIMKNNNSQDNNEMSNNNDNNSEIIMPSAIYGATHLLRLFVKMPSFLFHAKFPSSHIHVLYQHFKDLLCYISKNSNVFSSEKYNASLDSVTMVTS